MKPRLDQSLQVLGDAIRQDLRIVAPFEYADDSAASVPLRYVNNHLSHDREVFRDEAQRANWIIAMGVEASTDDHQFWAKHIGEFGQFCSKPF